MMVNEATLYDNVTEIAEDYFGPVAPRFMSRLITNHLGKTPETITPADLPELTEWVKLTVAMLTDDQSLIKEFTARLDKLSRD
jgi:hypothetical protein